MRRNQTAWASRAKPHKSVRRSRRSANPTAGRLFDLGAGGSYAFAPVRDFAPDECVRGFGRKSRQFPVALEIFRRLGVVGNRVDRLVQRGNDVGRSSLRNPKPDPGRTFGSRIAELGQAGAVWQKRIT